MLIGSADERPITQIKTPITLQKPTVKQTPLITRELKKEYILQSSFKLDIFRPEPEKKTKKKQSL